MLPPSMRGDSVIVWSEVSLRNSRSVVYLEIWSCSYLDNRNNVGCRLVEFGQVDVEMVQLIILGLFMDQLRSFSDGINASQISCWLDVGIWWRR